MVQEIHKSQLKPSEGIFVHVFVIYYGCGWGGFTICLQKGGAVYHLPILINNS